MAATGDDVPIIQAENLTSNVRSILYRSAPLSPSLTPPHPHLSDVFDESI
jgi:hypothetical protein